ncbi:40S ribosomal protein [Mycena kentingensis (nom. inval.)]|nr:40S ribosomal protein [Mycena kentingensis (nom. inval.)]
MLLRPRRVPRLCLTRLYSADTNPVRSQEDWYDFQVKRAETGALVDIFSKYGSNRRQETTFRLRDNLKRPIANATVSSLLAAGAHFGHASTRMNRNFLPYAYGVRANSTIIDIDHTVPLLKRAANLTRAVAFAGGQILFVGTRPDLRHIVKAAADRIGRQGFYISDRWIPGTLTNAPELFGLETAQSMAVKPDLVVLLNPLSNLVCIQECTLSHIPTIAIVDSDADPRIVMYPIPANDESPQTAEIIAGILSIAGREGLSLRLEEEASAAETMQEKIDDELWAEVESVKEAEARDSTLDGVLSDEDEVDYDDLSWISDSDSDSDSDLELEVRTKFPRRKEE